MPEKDQENASDSYDRKTRLLRPDRRAAGDGHADGGIRHVKKQCRGRRSTIKDTLAGTNLTYYSIAGQPMNYTIGPG